MPNLQPQFWEAVQTRDKSFEGSFIYGVLSTKTFCRPGCPSRTPKQENVRFYETAEAAQRDGLRACLRCRPLSSLSNARENIFPEVCTFIRKSLEDREALKLESLSRRFNLSPFYFQRTFKAVIGVTPRQYVEALRIETLKEDLKTSRSVTDAIYKAGFGSSSRVYDRTDAHLGMTPRQYRSGGMNVEISYVTVKTNLGLIMLGATDRGLCFLEFGPSRDDLFVSLQQEYPAARCIAMRKPYSSDFIAWMDAFTNYLRAGQSLTTMPLAVNGTAFQRKVWSYLQTIPAGNVATYSEVAREIGHPKAIRAVASACAANRLALVVPCHRVIRGDGGLGGYRWGIDLKRKLLDLERCSATVVKKLRSNKVNLL